MSIMQVCTAGTAVHAMVSMSCLDAKRLVAFSTAWHVSVLSVLVPSSAAAEQEYGSGQGHGTACSPQQQGQSTTADTYICLLRVPCAERTAHIYMLVFAAARELGCAERITIYMVVLWSFLPVRVHQWPCTLLVPCTDDDDCALLRCPSCRCALLVLLSMPW